MPTSEEFATSKRSLLMFILQVHRCPFIIRVNIMRNRLTVAYMNGSREYGKKRLVSLIKFYFVPMCWVVSQQSHRNSVSIYLVHAMKVPVNHFFLFHSIRSDERPEPTQRVKIQMDKSPLQYIHTDMNYGLWLNILLEFPSSSSHDAHSWPSCAQPTRQINNKRKWNQPKLNRTKSLTSCFVRVVIIIHRMGNNGLLGLDWACCSVNTSRFFMEQTTSTR